MHPNEFMAHFDVDPARGEHYWEGGIDWVEGVPGTHYFDFHVLATLPSALRKSFLPQQEDYKQLFRWLGGSKSPTGQIVEQLLSIGYPGVRSHEVIGDKKYISPKNIGKMYSLWCGDDGTSGTTSPRANALYVTKSEASFYPFSQDYGRQIRGFVKREEKI